ncbi:MAG: Xaa-Pro dipeptidase [Gammaproteobacteria bacterium]|nr:Xaa-Pro dipeptidase [Gammaproteobacteria bacterium]MDH3767105.1 Xaa-Pro dipeptidase [Gammaproteobacteria bacterium]
MNDRIAELYLTHHASLHARHAEALTTTEYDWLIVYSGKSHPVFLDDSFCPFRANPHFKTWVPLPDHQGGAIVVGRSDTPRLVYLQPEDYWHSPPADPEGYWPAQFDLRIARSEQQVRDALSDLPGRIALIADHTVPADIASLGELNPPALINLLHFARATKTEYEVECMRRANAIAVQGHRAAEKAFRSGASEFEIHMDYCRACGQDPDQLPYGNIVALNGHGAVLHYCEYQHDHDSPQAFLIDAGAAFNGYAADITRTYCTADNFFAALIDSLDRTQQTICERAKPGVDYVDLHLEANTLLAAVLIEHGVLGCSAETAVELGIMATFFPHGLGHYIGAQVHDVGGHQATPEGTQRPPPDDHPFLRLTRTLQPGTVCTIEPGLYFIDMLLQQLRASDAGKQVAWDRVADFRPFGGARVEDDIHITATGHENLTRAQFAALQ